MHRHRRTQALITAALALLLTPATLLAQSPWERAAANLEITFTGHSIEGRPPPLDPHTSRICTRHG